MADDIMKRRGFVRVKMEDRSSIPYRELQALMRVFVPMRAEHLYMSNTILYHGYSEQFERVVQGCYSPEYEAICTVTEDGEISVELCKVEGSPPAILEFSDY